MVRLEPCYCNLNLIHSRCTNLLVINTTVLNNMYYIL